MKAPVFTVVLAGPDGAGKSTVTKKAAEMLPVPAKYIYMGVNLESSHLVLPTTRLLLEVKRALGGRPDIAGPSDPSKDKPKPKSLVKRTLKGLKSTLRLTNQIAEEWFRQVLVWYYQRKGYLVLFDRHFYYDYYFHDVIQDVEDRSLTRRIHGYMLEHFYPRPDFAIFLDAPVEVLFARKPEGSIEALEIRRQEYLRLQGIIEQSVIVDASKSVETVLEEVVQQIMNFYRYKGGLSQSVYETENQRA